jgi:hypothetical protein
VNNGRSRKSVIREERALAQTHTHIHTPHKNTLTYTHAEESNTHKPKQPQTWDRRWHSQNTLRNANQSTRCTKTVFGFRGVGLPLTLSYEEEDTCLSYEEEDTCLYLCGCWLTLDPVAPPQCKSIHSVHQNGFSSPTIDPVTIEAKETYYI